MTLPTLILNADCQPVSVVPLSTSSWEESIKLMFIDRVDVIASYSNWQVHSPSRSYNVPSVILLRDYIKVRRTIKFSKENVYLRDEFTCQYCNSEHKKDPSSLTLDHVIPRFLGGKTNWQNISTACMSCNLEKAHYMKMKPKNAPKRPSYWDLAAKQMEMPIIIPDASWMDYIGWDKSLITIKPPRRQL